jgi:dolichol-phosphate mannosyltransferase
MDADLQDPPELISEFVEWWQRGYDVVYGVRRDRKGEPLWRRMAMWMYYRMLSRLSPIDLPLDAGDFRLISRKVQREFLRFHESNRYVRGMLAYIGFRHKGIAYVRHPRRAGSSKFPLAKLISLGIDGIVSFSIMPLRVMLSTGCVVLCAALVYGIFAVIKFMQGTTPPGWTTTIILILAMSGVQIVFLGLIGEYVGRTYVDAKKRPLWIVAEELNTERHNTGASGNPEGTQQ